MSWWLPAATGLLVAGYLGALARRPATLPRWSPWRTAAWVAGVVLVAAALSPPLAAHAQHDHRLHMAQHLLLGMYAPLGLVLGAPVTLLLGSVGRGTGRRLAHVLAARSVHVLTHPVTAAVLSTGGLLLLYLTPLYGWSRERPAVHALVLAHLLAAGCVYTWAVAGPDPAPRRPGLPTRVAVLVAAGGVHAFLAKLLYAHPPAAHHAGSHAVAGAASDGGSVEAFRTAAQWMYYGGDAAELVLAAMLFAWWYRRTAPARRTAPPLRVAPS